MRQSCSHNNVVEPVGKTFSNPRNGLRTRPGEGVNRTCCRPMASTLVPVSGSNKNVEGFSSVTSCVSTVILSAAVRNVRKSFISQFSFLGCAHCNFLGAHSLQVAHLLAAVASSGVWWQPCIERPCAQSESFCLTDHKKQVQKFVAH